MSFDHKPTDELELQRIINAGGHVGADHRVNGGLDLSRAIGICDIQHYFILPIQSYIYTTS